MTNFGGDRVLLLTSARTSMSDYPNVPNQKSYPDTSIQDRIVYAKLFSKTQGKLFYNFLKSISI